MAKVQLLKDDLSLKMDFPLITDRIAPALTRFKEGRTLLEAASRSNASASASSSVSVLPHIATVADCHSHTSFDPLHSNNLPVTFQQEPTLAAAQVPLLNTATINLRTTAQASTFSFFWAKFFTCLSCWQKPTNNKADCELAPASARP